jgi:hypothetical protein
MKHSLACASCSSIDLPARNGLYRMATPLVPQIFKKNVVYEGFCKNERWHMLTTFVSSPYNIATNFMTSLLSLCDTLSRASQLFSHLLNYITGGGSVAGKTLLCYGLHSVCKSFLMG